MAYCWPFPVHILTVVPHPTPLPQLCTFIYLFFTFVYTCCPLFPFLLYGYSLYGMREEIVIAQNRWMSNKIQGFPPVSPASHQFPSLLGTISTTQTSSQAKAEGWVSAVGWPLTGSKPAPDSRTAPPIRRLRAKIQPIIGWQDPLSQSHSSPGIHKESAYCWLITSPVFRQNITCLFLIWTKGF